MDARTVEQIDNDIRCERAILAFELRSGERTAATLDTRARIDRLLDERLCVVVPDPQRTPPDAGHAGVVQ